jgi:hypothetical protein
MKRSLLALTLVILGSTYMGGQTVRAAMHLVPTGKGWAVSVPDTGTASQNTSAALWQEVARGTKSNGMIYHGGSIMPGTVHVYFVWYGNWSNGAKPSDSQLSVSLLESLYARTGGLGSSGLGRVASTYSDTKSPVSGAFYLVQSTTDNYSKGKNLSDAAVQAVVTSAIQSGRLPKDSNGLYFVLTSSDVNETSGFCTKYCGWHDHATILKSDIKFGFVGNSDRCAASCEAQSQSPNGDSGADGMASVLAHETMESLTDPDFTGWYASNGEEAGDKCAWSWGPVRGTVGYGAYNQTFGSHNYLIQMLWENNRGGGCVQTKGGNFYNQ